MTLGIIVCLRSLNLVDVLAVDDESEKVLRVTDNSGERDNANSSSSDPDHFSKKHSSIPSKAPVIPPRLPARSPATSSSASSGKAVHVSHFGSYVAQHHSNSNEGFRISYTVSIQACIIHLGIVLLIIEIVII